MFSVSHSVFTPHPRPPLCAHLTVKLLMLKDSSEFRERYSKAQKHLFEELADAVAVTRALFNVSERFSRMTTSWGTFFFIFLNKCFDMAVGHVNMLMAMCRVHLRLVAI